MCAVIVTDAATAPPERVPAAAPTRDARGMRALLLSPFLSSRSSPDPPPPDHPHPGFLASGLRIISYADILCRMLITERNGSEPGFRQGWASASLSPTPRTPPLGHPARAQGETLSSPQAKEAGGESISGAGREPDHEEESQGWSQATEGAPDRPTEEVSPSPVACLPMRADCQAFRNSVNQLLSTPIIEN